MKAEPAAVAAFFAALVNAAVLFGLDLTDEQTGALVLIVTLGAGLFVRQRVTPVG